MNELVNQPRHRKLYELEARMSEVPQADCPLKQYFMDGLYVRELFVPAGTAFVGYVHKTDCITIVAQGKIAINDGDGLIVHTAPKTLCCPAGCKKAGYAIEDTVWTDIYANPDNERDLDKLTTRYIEKIEAMKVLA